MTTIDPDLPDVPGLPELGSDPWLSEAEAAALIGTSQRSLARWRREDKATPPYYQYGRLVRYRTSEVLAFIESRRIA